MLERSPAIQHCSKFSGARPQSDFVVKPMLVQCHNMVGIFDAVPKRYVVELVFAGRQGA